MEKLLRTFLSELDERVGALNRDVVALEREPSNAALRKSLFREAHSIKGAAHAVGVADIERAAHRLEELFGARTALRPDDLLPLIDEIQQAGRRLRGADVAGTVRVAVEKLDALLNRADEPDELLLSLRMVPFGEACDGLDRAVRDLARAAGRPVELVVRGRDVELDRRIVERLRDPLLHLVRNAVDHGAAGRIEVSAEMRGGRAEIAVADDGRGIDLEAVRKAARRRGLAGEPLELIFSSGFTTAERVTEVSGRGVGLDVVREAVESVQGRIDVTTGPGTRIAMTVPLTLAAMRALLVAAGGERFALPDTGIERLVLADPDDLRRVDGRDAVSVGGTVVPVVSLAELLGLPTRERARPVIVIASTGERRVGFAVDEALDERRVVVKPLGRRLRSPLFFAATVAPDGGIALMVNVAEAVRAALGARPQRPLVPEKADERPPRRVLVVDDSITTRTLLRGILEAAGYAVEVAADGAGGWRALLDRGTDLVVADVEMPGMDGFALTEAIRGSRKFRELPVVLVTARETEADRARGMEAGADAYILKSGFDQRELIVTLGRLL